MGFADVIFKMVMLALPLMSLSKVKSAASVLVFVAVSCSTTVAPSTPFPAASDPSETGELTVVLTNHGRDMEGHTPRGFQGMGSGLFAGDNLNPGFPNGDGVQIFLTFDLSNLPAGRVLSATLQSDDIHLRGSPFEDLGPLLAQEVRYEKFSSELWNLVPLIGGHTCIFAAEKADEFRCDVGEVVRRSQRDGYNYAQLRLRMEKAGDGDGNSDLVAFFKTDSNRNEPGIFELRIRLGP